MSETKPYKVLSKLRHNGSKYQLGDSIELDAKSAAELLAAKTVGVASSAKAGGTPTPPAPPLEIPEKYKEYAAKTNKEQIEYIQSFSQEDFKENFEEYLKYSKADAKKAIQKRAKENAGE